MNFYENNMMLMPPNSNEATARQSELAIDGSGCNSLGLSCMGKTIN